MVENLKKGKRDQVGYGSSYRRGTEGDLGIKSEIGSVLGRQVWLIKPEKGAETSNPCLWMQAGVVDFKTCNNFYDCTRCKYDQGMLKQVERGKQISWQDAMRKKSALARVCRHSLTHRIERRVCAYDYECSTCDFDQAFEDVYSPKAAPQPFGVRNVKGFQVPSGCYFHEGHAWAQIESGGYLRVGMDDFALKLLGKADAFDLPLTGKEISQGTAGWGFKREANRAEVLSPVNGVIVEVNARMREQPGIANREPYAGGWLFVVHTPEIKGAFKTLMDESGSLSWMAGEVTKLEGMIEAVAGPLAADGGYMTDDIYGSLPGLGWKDLTRTFLKNP